MDDLIAAVPDIGRQLPPDAEDVVSRHDLRGDAHGPGLLGEGAVPKADQLGGDRLVQILQQAEDVGLGPAGVPAADEVNDLHRAPFCKFRIVSCALPESII